MNDTDDDNPHYDDLIRELRALKRFIDGNGGEEADAVEDGSSHHASAGDNEPVAPGERHDEPLDASSDADELPTLREAVRRPRRRDELQLDLLSLGGGGDAEDKAEPDRETDLASVGVAPAREPAPEPAPEPDHAPADAGTADPGTDPRPQVEAAAVEAEDTGPASPDDDTRGPGLADEDTVLAFVLDLSDRILDTIEDRLIERSGERLPDDLRDDLRTAIGDILYEWCER